MSNIDPMQQEAMRRVQAMQSKAMPQRQNKREEKTDSALNLPHMQKTQGENESPPKSQNDEKLDIQHQNSSKNTLEVLFRDKEQNLILMLILLLAGEGADVGLLLALIYLLI